MTLQYHALIRVTDPMVTMTVTLTATLKVHGRIYRAVLHIQVCSPSAETQLQLQFRNN